MTGLRIGSLCSGYGGLEGGLMQVVGGTVAWHAENDPHASKVLAAHWPDVPNLGDITTVDWTKVESVDWLTAGYPCPPFSLAGKRKGEDDPRHIWPHIARAIAVLRPRHVLLENVAGHVSLGLDRVTADLAALGYVGRYGVVRASDAGAPHERARVFIVADASGGQLARSASAGDRLPVTAECRVLAPADSADGSGESQRPRTQPRHGSLAVADTPGDGRDEGRPESAGLVGRPDAAERGHASAPDTDRECVQRRRESGVLASSTRRQRYGDAARDRCAGDCAVGWDWRIPGGKDYGPAIRRWHDLTRCVPPPTVEGRNGPRLNPRLNEWMMGLPAGWVTDILSRNPALKVLGNGVVPAQAALAVRTLLNDIERAAV